MLVASCWGCSSDSECDGPRGEPGDVTTDLGAHDGFELLECPERASLDFEVHGLGQQWFMGVEPGAPNRAESLEAFSSEVLVPALGGVPALVLSGATTTCTGTGPAVLLESWGDVDAVVASLGQSLRDADLRESVAISVTGEVCRE